MSFDLILVGTDAAGDEKQVAALIERTLRDLGARGKSAEALFLLADGSLIEMSLEAASLHLSIRDDTKVVMEAIFALAEATGAFIVPVENPVAIRTPSNHRDPADADVDGLKLHEAADVAELAEHLSGGYGDWSDYRDQVVTHTPTPPPPTPPSSVTPPAKKGWLAGLLSKS
jgi:hypothetical protein